MLWRVVYIFGILSQFSHSYEIDDYEFLTSDFSTEEYQDDFLPVDESSEIVNDKSIESQNLVVDRTSNEEELPEDEVIFAGPVKAKGSVSVAATFGFDSPASYQPASSFNPSWFPAFYPQHFLSSSPMFAPRVPFIYSEIYLLSQLLPGIGSSIPGIIETDLKETNGVKGDSKEEVTPLKKKDIVRDMKKNSAEIIDSEETPKPEAFLYEDFPDYDAEDQDPLSDDSTVKGPNGAVFGGFVPASGSVKIAARF